MKIKKKKTLTIAKIKDNLQKNVVNPYIRKRDTKDGYFKCISCGQTKPSSECQAGHYIPVGKSQFLRFNELNINAECRSCNLFDKNFHLIPYRQNLVKKIGLEAVEALEAAQQNVKLYKWTRDKLIEVENYYKSLTNGKE